MNGDEFGLLRSFVSVAQERSFTRAAAKLGVSTSALSHAVRKLEERVGVRLLTRTTRSVAPTEAGARLLTQVRPAMTDIELSLDDLSRQRERPSGRIRLLASVLATRMILAPKLTRFAVAYPDVTLEVVANSETTDLISAGFDAGVHLGEFVEQDMLSIRVSRDQRAALVGSPAYFQTHPIPTVPKDLIHHRCVGYRMGASTYRWEFEKRGRNVTTRFPWAMIVDDIDLMTRAALDGVGLIWTFEDYVAPHLASGALTRVLEDWCAPFPGFYLYYPNVQRKPAALAALIETLKA